MELSLGNNNISDISPLASLTKLFYLGLGNNNISDISALMSNTGICCEDIVHLRDNPIDCDDAVTQSVIETLEERDVDLHISCP